MPTITFSLKDLQKLVGKNLSIEEVSSLLEYGKGEVEEYNKEEDEITVSLGDTNLPYLWSVEGIARLFRSVLGKEKGIPKLKIQKGPYKIIVENSVTKVRPYIAACIVKGAKVDNHLIKQLIQLQEKLCENYGRKREKVAMGIYRCDKIKFPVYYKASSPETIKFVPLDFKKEMTQQEILESHPKGIEYAKLLVDQKKYPLLIDDNREVLSFPPIINAAATGRVEEGDENLFIEATGTDFDSVLLSITIIAYALADRGFQIISVDVKYPNKTVTTPKSFGDSIKMNADHVRSLLGISLKDSDIKSLLEKARFGVSGSKVLIPDYRKDILHEVDLVEEVGILYGYEKIKESALKSYTVGQTVPIIKFIDEIRELLIGLQIHEIMSSMLTNKELLYNKMNIKDFGTVEIENKMTETFAVARSWLMPIVLEFLAKNKHYEYPQRVFEQGLVTMRKGDEIREYERLAVALCSEKADFTKIKQVLDVVLSSFGLEYTIDETVHGSFIEGRVGRVIVKGKEVAYIGEIHPQVLANFDVQMPIAACELNLSELFEILQKKDK